MARASAAAATDAVPHSGTAVVPRAFAAVPGGLALILFLATCSPTVNFTDSGELATVAWVGGIAHPPGYPLYTLLSILFIHIPLGNPAWRLNVLSTLTAALAVGLFYMLIADTLADVLRLPYGRSTRDRRGQASVATRSRPSAKANRAHAVGGTPRQLAGQATRGTRRRDLGG